MKWGKNLTRNQKPGSDWPIWVMAGAQFPPNSVFHLYMDDYLIPLYHIYQQINVTGDIYKECSEECNMLYKVVTYQIYNIRFLSVLSEGTT